MAGKATSTSVPVLTCAGVAYPRNDLMLIGKHSGDDHLAARAGEFDRIRQQVECDLANRAGVGDDLRQCSAAAKCG